MFGALRKKRASQQEKQRQASTSKPATHSSDVSHLEDQATIDMLRTKSNSRHPHSKDDDDMAVAHRGQDLGEPLTIEEAEHDMEDEDDDDNLFKFMPPVQTAGSEPAARRAALLPAHDPLETAPTTASEVTENIGPLPFTSDGQSRQDTARSRPLTAARSSWDHALPGLHEARKATTSAPEKAMTEAQQVALDYQSSKDSTRSKRSGSPQEVNFDQPRLEYSQSASGSQKRRQPYQYPDSPVYSTAPNYLQAGLEHTSRQNTSAIELADRQRQFSTATATYPPEYGFAYEEISKRGMEDGQQYSKHFIDIGNGRTAVNYPQAPQNVRHRTSNTYSKHDDGKGSADLQDSTWTTPTTPGSNINYNYPSNEYGFNSGEVGLDSKVGIGIESRDGVHVYPTSGRFATEDGMESTAVGSTPGIDTGKGSFQPFELEDEEDSPYPEVRASVSNIDDPEMPCLTFRAIYLGLSSVFVCSLISFFSQIRFPFPYITPLTIQILTYPAGKALAYILPTNTFKTPRFLTWIGAPPEWSLNPGPFNIKEHTVIIMMANMALNPSYALGFSMTLDKYYNAPKGLTFDWLCCISTYVIGFSFAGLCRRYLVWPASLIWPQNLVICTVFNTFHAEDDDGSDGSLTRFRYFSYVLAAASIWYILPGERNPISQRAASLKLTCDLQFIVIGFLFRALSVFSFICWMAPQSKVVNQLFGVTTGLGMSVFTFDWIQISYLGSPLIVPWWAALNIFLGFALLYWVLVPILYYTNVSRLSGLLRSFGIEQ